MMEEKGKQMWGHLPGANYTGFMGQEPDPTKPNGLSYGPRSDAPFYFPIYVSEVSSTFFPNPSN
jgi:hypothetical protein